MLFAVMAMLMYLPIIANAKIVDSGECGTASSNVTWTLDDAGTLTISGEGDMGNYIYERHDGNGSNPTFVYCNSPFWDKSSTIKNVIIEEGVTNIGNSVFPFCYNMDSITIPDSVASIGEQAFLDCRSLTNMTIPDSVTNISNSAFNGCSSLESIHINPNNQIYTDIDGVLFNKAKTELIYYPKNKRETHYTIPDSITKIDNYIFMGCGNLTSVAIPDTITCIGDSAFSGCIGLTSVEIPDSVKSIGAQAFEECSGLTSITIGRGVTSIFNRAFEKCYNLDSVYISDLTAWCNIDFRIYTYYSNDGSYHTTYYSSNPLYYAHKLYINNQLATDIVFPNSVTSISKNAFRGCGLKSVTIPNSITNIGQYAFTGSGLQSITIQDGISRIQQYAFSGCSSLKSVTIPKSVQNIANNAFENCKALSDIYYAGTADEWRNINIGTTGNDGIGNAIIHYNSTSMPEPTPVPKPTPTPTPAPTPYIPLDCNVDYAVENNKITFDVEVKDSARADELNNVQLFKTIFDENGQFIGVTFGEKSTVNDGKIVITSDIPDTDTYKFFLWDGQLAPLMGVIDKENVKMN